ncbi:MAG: hypothetical protein JNJ49_14355 [Bdellovibrionaceae bacterium]|nr:hypothetical protein [Pseudobdellovibrionaceae bacterium]
MEEQQEGITTRKADLGSVNGLQRYYTAISGDYRFTSVGEAIEEKHGLLSLNTARGWANRKVAERLRDEPTSIGMVGRSPSFESVIGWCEEGKPGRLQTSRSRQTLEANETTHALAFHLEHEAKELERRVKYAQNAPDPNEPEKGRLQKSKEDFERCEADVASSAKARAEKEADYKRRLADWKSEREPFLDDPKAPFRYLLTSLDTAVADSSKSGVIRDRFMDSIKNDLHNLRRSGLPRVRWGAIEKLIVDVEAGRTTSDWIVAKVKQQLKDIRTACINGDFEKSPCYPEKWIPLRNLSTLLLGIGVPVPAKVADGRLMNNCATGESFGCIYKTDTNSAKLPMAFERYWSPKPILDEASTSCGTDFYSGAEWVGFQKTLANVKMDKECVEDFILRAPDDEFENLKRLDKLGSRDARGYVDVAPEARTERSKLRKVTK